MKNKLLSYVLSGRYDYQTDYDYFFIADNVYCGLASRPDGKRGKKKVKTTLDTSHRDKSRLRRSSKRTRKTSRYRQSLYLSPENALETCCIPFETRAVTAVRRRPQQDIIQPSPFARVVVRYGYIARRQRCFVVVVVVDLFFFSPNFLPYTKTRCSRGYLLISFKRIPRQESDAAAAAVACD